MNFQNVQFEASYGLFSQIPPCTMPEFAFSGRSNVGKSSLINKLFNRKQLARVSAMPGKTTTINFFRLENIRFADLPGYGYAKVSKKEKDRWSGLIGDYLASDRDIALVFQLIDMRHPPTKDDLTMIDYLIECEMPFAIVLTKMDKLSKRERQERLDAFMTEIPYADQITILPVSSETGEGMEEVRQIIEELAVRESAESDDFDGEEEDTFLDELAEEVQEAVEEAKETVSEAVDEMEEAIRRFRESVRSGQLDRENGAKLPTRERKKNRG